MKLVQPSMEYMESYREAVSENAALPENTFRDLPPEELLQMMESWGRGEDMPEGYVPESFFWLVEGDRFLAQATFRHHLTPDLERFGGHIGYGVRRSEWNKGIGTEMLRQLLVFLREQGSVARVLITCYDENIGSARVIEKNDGVLQDKIENVIDGERRLTRRYWITL